MNRITAIRDNVLHNFTWRRFLAVTLGNFILGVGIAGLKLSGMGNDPYTASTMALSEGFRMGLGNYQLLLNLVLAVVQFLWGYSYIGIGTLVNMCLLGYIVQFTAIPLEMIVGSAAGHSFGYGLVYMAAALVVVSFGLSMYQVADLGVAPYDYLSIGMTDHFKLPYFANRVITDAACVGLILVSYLVHFIGWESAHLGVATVVCAFCLGPLVDLFSRVNRKWIR